MIYVVIYKYAYTQISIKSIFPIVGQSHGVDAKSHSLWWHWKWNDIAIFLGTNITFQSVNSTRIFHFQYSH